MSFTAIRRRIIRIFCHLFDFAPIGTSDMYLVLNGRTCLVVLV